MEKEAEGDDEVPDVARGLQALSPQLRVALCSPDVSQLLGLARPAVFAAAGPPLHGAKEDEQEKDKENRVLIQPIAVLTGAQEGTAADVLHRLRRLSFSAEYCGRTAIPVSLDLVAAAAGVGQGVGLAGAGAAVPALELRLPVATDELLQSLRTRPLQIDVWDGDSGFALGSVAVSGMARLVRQGHAVVYFYDICPFVQPLAPPADHEIKGNLEPRALASAAATKEVQVRGLERGASVAFRIISCAHEPPPEAHADSAGWGGGVILSHKNGDGGTSPARVPFKARNSDRDAGSMPESQPLPAAGRGFVESLLKLADGAGGFSGWHRVHPDQRDLPQRAALALVFVNQNSILDALRAAAQARAAESMATMILGESKGVAGGPLRRRRWSEVWLSAEDALLTDALKHLDLDARHLHALCLKLQEAAAGPEGTQGGGGERMIDLQSLLLDSRYSPSLELKGEVTVGKMDALDIQARRGIQRLVRDVLGAMVGRSLWAMRNPVELFAISAPTGTMTSDGFRELVSMLQVTASDSVVYAGWRAMCQDSVSEHGVDVVAFLNFFSVSAVHRQQACSLKLLSTVPSPETEAHGPGNGRAGGGVVHAGGLSARMQRQLQLLKDLLKDSDLWREYREACAAVRAAQKNPGGSAEVGGKEKASGGAQSVSANATPVTAAAGTSTVTSSGKEKKGVGGGEVSEDTLEEREKREKTRDNVLKDLARFLKPKVADMSEKELRSALVSLHDLQAADHQRKAARLRALLSAQKDAAKGDAGEATGSTSAVPHRAGSAGADRATDEAGGADERGGKEGCAGRGEGKVGWGGVSEDAVRKALELKGLLSKGGGWAPARIAAEVPIGRAGTRVLCPLVNRSEQTLCFELLTATAEPCGAGCGDHNHGVVRIDNADQELQLLKKFHMCRFVEAHAHSADSSSSGTASKGRTGDGKVNAEVVGGVVGVKVLLQPHARVMVPLVFFRGQMLCGSRRESPVTMRVRRACADGTGQETFDGAILLEERLLVCGSVLPPQADHVVRLFVRDFVAKFGNGSSFAVRQHLRFPHSAPEKEQDGSPAHLEEIWMSLSAAGACASKQKQETSMVRSKTPLVQTPQSMQNQLKVEADIMRFEGRRWIRVPGESVSDRLVTEPLPVANPSDTNHVRYFCTSLLALPERSLGSSTLFEWSEQWGGDMDSGGHVARPVVFSNVERQWVWEIRPVLHHIITMPPPGAATSEVIAGAEQAETFNVEVTLERPVSLWGQDGVGVVYSSAPLSVRSEDKAQISVQGKNKVELRLQVSRRHDASPVFLHVMGENGLLSVWQLTFVQPAARARMTSCGVRFTLEEFRFTRKGQVLLPSRGRSSEHHTMELADLKTHLKTDLAQALGCDVMRLQITKISAREALPRGPALEVFRSFDTDGSGKLERRELKFAMKQMRMHGLMIEDIDALLAILDPSGDGEVTFEEFVAALDAGLDVHVLLLPILKTLLDEDEESGPGPAVQVPPAGLAENLYKLVVDSLYGTSTGGGGSGLVGLLRYCGEMEVLPTSLLGLRGQSREHFAAVRIQKRVRGAQVRDKKRRLAQNQETVVGKIQELHDMHQQRAANTTSESEGSARKRQVMSTEIGEEQEEGAEEVEDSEEEVETDVSDSDHLEGGGERDGAGEQARARRGREGGREDAEQEEAEEAGGSEVSDSPRESEVGTSEKGGGEKERDGAGEQERARGVREGDAEQEEAEEAGGCEVSDSPCESEVGTGEKGVEQPRTRARASAVEGREDEQEEDVGEDVSDLSASDGEEGGEQGGEREREREREKFIDNQIDD